MGKSVYVGGFAGRVGYGGFLSRGLIACLGVVALSGCEVMERALDQALTPQEPLSQEKRDEYTKAKAQSLYCLGASVRHPQAVSAEYWITQYLASYGELHQLPEKMSLWPQGHLSEFYYQMGLAEGKWNGDKGYSQCVTESIIVDQK